jgi:hypothetical protein
MNRQRYESDITREQYEMIRSLLENSRKKTRPREVDLTMYFARFCMYLN